MKLNAHPLGFGAGMTEAVITNGAQSSRQDVPQIALDKLDARNGRCFYAVVIGAIFPPEGDGVIVDSNNSGIVNGRASDVSAEVLECGGSGASRLNVHSPIFRPDGGIDLPVVFFKETIEVLPKGRL